MTELIPTVQTLHMESQHSIGAPSCRDFPRFVIISQISRPEVGSLSRCYQKTCAFGKNDPLPEDFENFVLKGFTISQIHVLCANFVKFGLPEIGRVVCYLPDKKETKKSARSLPLASARIAPKICRGQRQTMYSQCPKFHPNRFTSGRVIAERVNTVQARHKVFPILGEASASSPSNNKRTRWRLGLRSLIIIIIIYLYQTTRIHRNINIKQHTETRKHSQTLRQWSRPIYIPN